MKKHFSLALFFIIITVSSQIKFEKGYITNNENLRSEVLIKNIDWLENPTEFTYKNDENSAEKNGKISDIKEFQVYGYNKLVRYKGKINVSSNDLQNLSSDSIPEWKDEEIYLYELTSGDKKLYSYYKKSTINFFYSEKNGEIIPLIYKQYYPEGNSSLLAHNNTYKQQLKKLFSQDAKILNLIDDAEYTEKSLLKIFNENAKESTDKNSIVKDKTKLNLYLKSGISLAKFNVYSPYYNENLDANFTSTSLRFGIEGEVVLPFNKNKWSLLVEPSYMSFKGSSISKDQSYIVSADYSYIEFNIGFRHYLYLNNTSKFFANVKFPLYIMNVKDGAIKYTPNPDYNIYGVNYNFSMDFNHCRSSFIFGFGYNYKDKFSVEINTTLKRSINTYGYSNWSNSLSYNSLLIGYNIF